jgi:hypothetical protein
VAVDAGAAHAEYRVDSSKPFDGNGIPSVLVDIVVDAEEDRRRVRAARRGMQLQSRLCVGHAAVVPAGEVRRGSRPSGLAVLEVADDLKTRRA